MNPCLHWPHRAWCQSPRISYKFPMWVAETQLFEPSLLLPSIIYPVSRARTGSEALCCGMQGQDWEQGPLLWDAGIFTTRQVPTLLSHLPATCLTWSCHSCLKTQQLQERGDVTMCFCLLPVFPVWCGKLDHLSPHVGNLLKKGTVWTSVFIQRGSNCPPHPQLLLLLQSTT